MTANDTGYRYYLGTSDPLAGVIVSLPTEAGDETEVFHPVFGLVLRGNTSPLTIPKPELAAQTSNRYSGGWKGSRLRNAGKLCLLIQYGSRR